MASSSILLRSPSVDPYNPPHHQPTHEPSPSSLSHASQIPLPATPSTPSRRRQREAEEEAEETVGRRKRVETGGSAGSAGEKLKEVREEAESSTSGRAPPVEQEQMVDGKRIKELPFEYMQAPEEDLVILIASMLTKLIQHNDQVPLLPEHLTRFHSRAPPSISVVDYLHRIVKYTNIEKSPLLLLLPYLDAFCLHLPTFTLSSLTVHRFLISSCCVASKALCDSFCTNAHYAKVGGIRVGELNLLERELVSGLGWKLTCDGSLLQSYYTSLISSYSTTPAPPPPPSTTTSSSAPAIQIVYVQGLELPPKPPPSTPWYLPWPSWESFEVGRNEGTVEAGLGGGEAG
ncbi:cyclin-domain-containing protein [Mrakia frigida]|uniref:Pho80p n=1 Tax=Mrakia frigida TaxID=29902 RepID=UPI003FCC21D1